MIVQCHECSKKLKVPDTAVGRKVKCPSCSSVLIVESSDPAAQHAQEGRPARTKKSVGPDGRRRPSSGAAPVRRRRPANPVEEPFEDDFSDLSTDDYDDQAGFGYDDAENPYAAPQARSGGRRKSRRRNTEGLNTVGTGLLVQGWAIAVMIISIPVLVIAGLLQSAALVALAGIFLLVAMIGGAIAMLVGELMCLAAPSESNAKMLIVAAVSCHAVSFLANIAGRLGAAGTGLTIVGGIAGLGYFVLFLLFLKSIATYAGFEDHAGRAKLLLIGIPISWVLVVGGSILAGVGMMGGGAGIGIFAVLLMLVMGLVALVLFVTYVNLLFKLGGDLRTV